MSEYLPSLIFIYWSELTFKSSLISETYFYNCPTVNVRNKFKLTKSIMSWSSGWLIRPLQNILGCPPTLPPGIPNDQNITWHMHAYSRQSHIHSTYFCTVYDNCIFNAELNTMYLGKYTDKQIIIRLQQYNIAIFTIFKSLWLIYNILNIILQIVW